MPYCDACETSHKVNNKALCEKNQGKQINLARVTRAVAKMAKALSRDSSPDLCTQFSTLTLEERELKAWKEIEVLELEERAWRRTETSWSTGRRNGYDEKKMDSSFQSLSGQYRHDGTVEQGGGARLLWLWSIKVEEQVKVSTPSTQLFRLWKQKQQWYLSKTQ